MKKKGGWYLVAVLILGMAILAISCGGPATPATPTTPTAPAAPPVPTTPSAEPATAGPSAIRHTLEGRDDCLVCHGESGFKPYPADHTGRTNNTCASCHQPAS